MNYSGDNVPEGAIIRCPSLLEWQGAADKADLAPNEIGVWLVDLDAGLSPEEVVLAEPGPELDVLADDERARAGRFVRARDRRRFAGCRAALRMILGGLLGQSPSSLRLRAGGQGKPELDPDASAADPARARVALRFNVSHSSELALIAVCRGRELGVDIERVRTIREADRIVASYFSPAEQAEFGSFATDARSLAFFRGWTRKEAILKGLGIGLAGLAAQFETRFGTTDLASRFVPATPSPQVDQWLLWEAAPRTGFVATLAVRASTTAEQATAGSGGLASVVASPGNEAVN
jgi:4'-phosphopantetheinyl transferase